MHDVFLSYASQDASYAAAAIEELLGRELRPESIFRSANIGFGVDWRAAIDRAVREAAVMVVIVGPGWQDLVSGNRDGLGGWVGREIAEALRSGVAVLPVLLDNARLNSAELPPQLHGLADRNFARVRQQFFPEDVYELARTLRQLAPDRLPPPVPLPRPLRTAEEIALSVPAYSDNDIRLRGTILNQQLIGLPDKFGHIQYPVFQFDEAVRPIEVVVRVNSLLGASDDPWGVIDWWLSTNIWLGAAPVDLLGNSDDEIIVAAANVVSRQD